MMKVKRKASIYMLIMLLISLAYPILSSLYLHNQDLTIPQLLAAGTQDYVYNLLILGIISSIIVTYRRNKPQSKTIKATNILDFEDQKGPGQPFWFELIENIFSLYLIATVFAAVVYICLFFFS